MELVYAALVLHEAGKEVNEDNLEAIVDAVDLDVDSSEIKALVAALEDVDIEEAMATAVATGGAAAPAAAPEEDTAEEEAEDEEEEEDDDSEEEAAAGLGELF